MRQRLYPVLLAGSALVLLSSLLSCRTLHARYHLGEADKLYQVQKYEAAIEKYQEVLEVDPKSWEANHRIAMSYLALYHPGSTHPKDVEAAEMAQAALEACFALQAPDPETAAKLKRLYLGLLVARGNVDQAIVFNERLLESDPEDVAVTVQLANLYAKKGDFPNALKTFERQAVLEPNKKDAWYMVGVLCWERCYRGGSLVSLGEREELIAKGLASLDRALAIDPKSFDALAYVNLLHREEGKLLQARGDAQGAAAAYAKADEFLKKSLALRTTSRAAAK